MDEQNLNYETLSLFTVFDVFAIPFTLGILYLFARFYFNRYEKNQELKTYYYTYFFLKMAMLLVYACLVQFYWQVADTKGYYIDLQRLQIAISRSPEILKDLYLTSSQSFLDTHALIVLEYIPGQNSIHLYRFLLPINALCFGNYMATGMIINFFSFLGGWCIFKSFLSMYPRLVKGAAFAALFYPSVLFWSSCGIMKDPVAFGALGFLFYSVNGLMQNRKLVQNSLAILFFSFMLLQVKSYILITFAAGVSLWIGLTLIKRITIPALRALVVLFSLVVVMAGTFAYFQQEASKQSEAGASSSLLDPDQALGMAAALKEHYAVVEAGSSFDVDIEYTTTGLIKFFPQAMVINMFRPFLWESKNVIMLLSSAEALFNLLFILFLLVKQGLLTKLNIVFSGGRNMILLLIFPLLFFFIVAMSTFNFGTLARYKIPAVPFFIFLLFVLDELTRTSRNERRISTVKLQKPQLS